MSKKIYIFLIVSLLFVGCADFFNGSSNDKIIAVVGSKKLTYSEMKMAVPANMKEIDSISFAQNYIEKWVKNQLLLEKAELNLNKETKQSIEIMIENYRTSLLLFKYQQLLIHEKLDTLVTDAQIEEYYTDHSGNFRLDSNVVKAIYVQLPKAVYDGYRVRSWVQNPTEENMITLEDYCYQNARNFYMNDEWQYLGNVLGQMPNRINNQENFLKYSRFLETSDSLYRYYLTITDYKLKTDTTPIVFVKSQIQDILINHRKVKLINDLENNIYSDAVNQKKFTIYTN
jgi:hypothetical protein